MKERNNGIGLDYAREGLGILRCCLVQILRTNKKVMPNASLPIPLFRPKYLLVKLLRAYFV